MSRKFSGEFVAVRGPLAVHAEGFVAVLEGRGCAPRTIETQLRMLRDLSGWLEDRGIDLEASGRRFSATMPLTVAGGRRRCGRRRDWCRWSVSCGREGRSRLRCGWCRWVGCMECWPRSGWPWCRCGVCRRPRSAVTARRSVRCSKVALTGGSVPIPPGDRSVG